jgi:hypothetical protein
MPTLVTWSNDCVRIALRPQGANAKNTELMTATHPVRHGKAQVFGKMLYYS